VITSEAVSVLKTKVLPPAAAVTVAAAANVPAWKLSEVEEPATPERLTAVIELLPVEEFVPVEVGAKFEELANVSMPKVRLPGVVTAMVFIPELVMLNVVVPVASMSACVTVTFSMPAAPRRPAL
jgi:hypothetical protein